MRILTILDIFDMDNRALTAAEIARRVGDPVSSVYRSIQTLKERGYIAADEKGLHRLQPKLLRLASVVRADTDVLQAARAPMERLTQQTHQTSLLAVVSESHALCLESTTPGRAFDVTTPPGKLFPLHAGASARVLLAHLSRKCRTQFYAQNPPEKYTSSTTTDMGQLEDELAAIRKRGYDFTSGQYEHGIFACSVPVTDSEGSVVASLSVVGVIETLDGGEESLLQPLKRAATEISEQL